ncbi:MAG TPA: SurA N-terminal domain-containing protein [Xanthomonadales bacterium]|nr:SurA N-terminal domain-containing protein [Xanthomonadales bacterium]
MLLQKFRDRLTGIMAIFILGLLAVPFALVGVTSYFAPETETNVAIVNEEGITVTEFNSSFQNYRERMRSLMGTSFDAALFDDPVVRREHLETMIERELLRQVSIETGLSVDDQFLAQAIRDVPGFQMDGVFNTEVYQNQLTSQGLTPQEFEDRMRSSMILRQYPATLSASAIATSAEVDRFIELQQQERAFGALLIMAEPEEDEAEELIEEVAEAAEEAAEEGEEVIEAAETEAAEAVAEIEESRIEQWYEDNADEYRHPERVVIEYVELNAELMEPEEEIDDDMLRQRFEDQSGRFITPEARLASHILISVDPTAPEADIETARQEAQALADRALEGEDFAELAREFSEDQGSAPLGGDLDWVEPGFMVEAFESALYELDMSEPISEPVQTGFGWHIIQLREIRPAEGMTFEEARETLLTELTAEQNERVFLDAADRLVDIIYEDPTTLEAAADELDLEIQEVGPFDRSGMPGGVAANPEFVETAFSDLVLLQDSASDPVDLGLNHIAVLRVREHLPEAAKTLDEVRDEVIVAIRQDDAMKAAEARATALLERIESGESLELLAEETGLELIESEGATRTSNEIRFDLRSELFELKAPEGDEARYAVLPLDDGYAVVALRDVRPGALSEEEEARRDSFRQRIANVRASSETQAFLTALRNQSQVQVFEDRIRN